MTSETPSRTYIDLYTSFLKSLTHENAELADLSMEVTLGDVLYGAATDSDFETQNIEISKHEMPTGVDHFRAEELLTYGTPVRRHLASSTTSRLREEIENTLRSIAEFFQGDEGSCPEFNRLPEHIQARKDEIGSKQLEVASLTLRVTELLTTIKSTREDFDGEIRQLIITTFPALDAARTASIEHLAATLEAALQRLNAVREHTRRSFYNHQCNNGRSVSQALATAYESLKEEEKDLKLEAQKLDQRIHEYETLLQLVDGDSGGYRQIVRDWLEVKQGTDECMKDLKRLGWSGD